MRICISSGHGKHIRGAAGSPVPPQCDEVDEVRKIVDRVAQILNDGGVPTVKFHDDKSTTQDQNLSAIVGFHNAQTRDLDVSVHLNATPGAHGTEVWYMTQEALAAKASTAIAKAGGFTDRGPKYSSGLYFLSNTSEPAVLVETFFCDSTSDCNLYRANFEKICMALAEALAGHDLGDHRPPVEQPPPSTPDTAPRPTIGKGDYGFNVRELQAFIGDLVVDGDFGSMTKIAVEDVQRTEGLTVDGVVGPETWGTIDFGMPPYPPALPAVFSRETIEVITEVAINQPIADYNWRDRGRAPAGYVKGMALAYAQAYARLKADDPLVLEAAKANTHNDSYDALSWYDAKFRELGWSNEVAGVNTLRHLHVLIMGLGMRESSGKHCTGRDQSADNTDSVTCESGLFQTSWNASTCCTDFVNLFDQYAAATGPSGAAPQGYLTVWAEGVDCSAGDWQSYGSGDGLAFQEMCKRSPTFAVESCAITLRNLRQHYGPINRKEAELRREANEMFLDIQKIVDALAPEAQS